MSKDVQGNLWELAKKLTTAKPFRLNLEEEGKVLATVEGTFKAIMLPTVAWIADENTYSDIHFVRQDVAFTPSKPADDSWNNRGWYVHAYRIETVPLGREFEGSIILESSPPNDAGMTTVSVGSSYSFGGGVGFSGMGPSGDVSANYSVNYNETYSVADITLENDTLPASGAAKWVFKMPLAELKKDATDYHLSETKPSSRSYFQPKVWAVWKTNGRKDDEFVLRTRVEIVFARTKLYVPDAGGWAYIPIVKAAEMAFKFANSRADHEFRSVHTSFDIAIECADVPKSWLELTASSKGTGRGC